MYMASEMRFEGLHGVNMFIVLLKWLEVWKWEKYENLS
jgi:hypothetical protein